MSQVTQNPQNGIDIAYRAVSTAEEWYGDWKVNTLNGSRLPQGEDIYAFAKPEADVAYDFGPLCYVGGYRVPSFKAIVSWAKNENYDEYFAPNGDGYKNFCSLLRITLTNFGPCLQTSGYAHGESETIRLDLLGKANALITHLFPSMASQQSFTDAINLMATDGEAWDNVEYEFDCLLEALQLTAEFRNNAIWSVAKADAFPRLKVQLDGNHIATMDPTQLLQDAKAYIPDLGYFVGKVLAETQPRSV